MHNMSMSCATTVYILDPDYIVNAIGQKIGENLLEKVISWNPKVWHVDKTMRLLSICLSLIDRAINICACER